MSSMQLNKAKTFVHSASILLVGAVIAQLIPVLISPIITRIYSPHDYGLYSLYMSVMTLIASVATGRYELSVMLPERDEDAAHLAIFSIVLAFFLAALIAIMLFFFGNPLAVLFGRGEIVAWLYWIPAAIVFAAIFQVCIIWISRKEQYVAVSSSRIGQSIITVATQLFVGIGKYYSGGLIIASLVGQGVTAVLLVLFCWRHERAKFVIAGWSNSFQLAKKYRKFLLFNTPYTLLGNFSKSFVIYALSAFSSNTVVGFFGLARSVMFLPLGLVTNSVGQVYFKKAALTIGTPALEIITVQILIKITGLITLPFLFFSYWAPEIFAIVFGEQWKVAGQYATALAPVAFTYLYASWPDRLYEVMGKQEIALYLQIISDVLLVSAVFGALWLGLSPLVSVWIYSLLFAAYNVAWLVITFRIAGFHLRLVGYVGMHIVRLILPFAALIFLLEWLRLSKPLQFGIGTLLITLYYAKILLWREET